MVVISGSHAKELNDPPVDRQRPPIFVDAAIGAQLQLRPGQRGPQLYYAKR